MNPFAIVRSLREAVRSNDFDEVVKVCEACVADAYAAGIEEGKRLERLSLSQQHCGRNTVEITGDFGSNKLQTIKLVRHWTDWGLLAAKTAVEQRSIRFLSDPVADAIVTGLQGLGITSRKVYNG